MASRIVHHGDGIEYLRRGPLPPDHAIVTSLPDHSELRGLGVDGWRRWFVETVTLACRALADDAVAIFYQSDVKHDGRWIDKSHLVMCGADAAGSSLLWHKIVCRAPAGTETYGRASYSHMLCVSRALRHRAGDPGRRRTAAARRDDMGARDGQRGVRGGDAVHRGTYAVSRGRRPFLWAGKHAGRRERAWARCDRRRAEPAPGEQGSDTSSQVVWTT